MTIFGKRLSEYIAFARPILILILVVALLRLGLSLGGVSISIKKFIAASVMVWIGVIYHAIRIHTTGFGSYKQLLVVCFLQIVTLQIVIIPAIILSIYTGQHNAFSAPEVNFGSDGRNWTHVLAHLFFAPTFGTLIGWLGGSLVMFITKKVAPRRNYAI